MLSASLQQMPFEKHCGKGEIAHHEQFHHLPQCFQLYLIIKLSLMEISHILNKMFSKSSSADLLYVGKGLNEECSKVHVLRSVIFCQKPSALTSSYLRYCRKLGNCYGTQERMYVIYDKNSITKRYEKQ